MLTPACTLPADFVPVVVVDASGRVRTSYERWEEGLGNLVRLPSAHNDYGQLHVRLWKKPTGRDALMDRDTCEEIAGAIAAEIEGDKDRRWLIVTYKRSKGDLRDAVERHYPDARSSNVRWLHWGKHLATNEFKDFENIVLVGQNTYSQNAYLALALSASGERLDPRNLPSTKDVRAGEMRHHLLQGLCRASVRKASGGAAGACTAYLVNNMGDAEAVLSDVFPGCVVRPWKDSQLPQGGLVQRTIDYLIDRFDGTDLELIRKGDLAREVGTSPGSLRNNITSKRVFEDFLDEIGLAMTTRDIRRKPCGFPPIDKGTATFET
jgi:hypothetical protein